MLKADLDLENESIELCKEIIKLAIEEDDTTTRFLTEKILKETEEHADRYKLILG